MKYGIPYMGSKSGIAEQIIKLFPPSHNFYDLFGGGFSMTHAMIRHRYRDFKTFHFNEIRPGVCDLIKDAISGKFNYNIFKPKFVSRDEFQEQKESNPYIKLIWSFGNNGRAYMFSEEIEPYKKSIHNAIVFNDFDTLAEQTLGMKRFREGFDIEQKRLFLRNRIEWFRVNGIPDFLKKYIKDLKQLERLQQLQQLKQLQQLERLQQLQQLQQLQHIDKIEFYNKDYREIIIEENSIIYCDIPYKKTADYGSDFSHEEFFNWANDHKCAVFISEYSIQDSRFTEIFNVQKRSNLSHNKNKCIDKTERVYINQSGLKLLQKRI